MNRVLKSEPLPEVYKALMAVQRGEPCEYPKPMRHLPVITRTPLKVRVMRLLILLTGGGPAVLFIADRVAHACGFCLGF